jgi:hypothetical protein
VADRIHVFGSRQRRFLPCGESIAGLRPAQ